MKVLCAICREEHDGHCPKMRASKKEVHVCDICGKRRVIAFTQKLGYRWCNSCLNRKCEAL